MQRAWSTYVWHAEFSGQLITLPYQIILIFMHHSVQYHPTKKNLCCLSFQLTHLVQSLYGCCIIRFDTNDEKLRVDPK